MGRRKIEIQPITHERNRSVTFLKRKNGLFKKAYELGVLCSVDVAVIIFEDRPGHELKLHSYSSSDIRNIVQRQLRHSGEKDAKGPHDFSGAGGRFDDGDGDDNEDVVDEEDEPAVTRASSVVGKRKAGRQNLASDTDYAPRSSHTHSLGPPHIHNLGDSRFEGTSGPSIGSLMPVSNDRVSSLRDSHTRASKRLRTSGVAQGRSRSPSLEHDHHAPAQLYLPGDTQMEHTGRLTRSMRYARGQEQGPNPIALQNPYQQQPQYTSPFVQLNGPGFERNVEMGPPRFGPQSHEPQYDPALYQPPQHQPLIRQQQGVPEYVPMRGTAVERAQRLRDALLFEERERDRSKGAMDKERERGGGDMFAAFLEADEQSRQMAAAQRQIEVSQQQNATGGASLDWPAVGASAGLGAGGSLDAQNPNDGGSWLDMFAGTTTSSSSAGARRGANTLDEDLAHLLGNGNTKVGPGGGPGTTPETRGSGENRGAVSQAEPAQPSDAEDADGEDDNEMEPTPIRVDVTNPVAQENPASVSSIRTEPQSGKSKPAIGRERSKANSKQKGEDTS